MENKKFYLVQILADHRDESGYDCFSVGIFDSLDVAEEYIEKNGGVKTIDVHTKQPVFKMPDEFLDWPWPGYYGKAEITINEIRLNPSFDEMNDSKNWV